MRGGVVPQVGMGMENVGDGRRWLWLDEDVHRDGWGWMEMAMGIDTVGDEWRRG